MSATRQLVAALRDRLAARDPMPARVALPPVEAPPARVYVPRLESSGFAREAARHTTALVGIGHVGTRYATDVVLQFQAELAVARCAVATELPDDWAASRGLLPVQSQVSTHREFLLRPDLGRRLDGLSLERLRREAEQNVDVQIIVADGLSALACMTSGPALAATLRVACERAGLQVGTLVAAKFARVWLQDEIGQETRARVAVILLGERPGLGTGDGLSAYMVYQPRVGKTDGERNMISNIHARGTPIAAAADRLAALAAAMIEQQCSGVALDLARVPGGSRDGRGYRMPQIRERLVDRSAPGDR